MVILANQTHANIEVEDNIIDKICRKQVEYCPSLNFEQLRNKIKGLKMYHARFKLRPNADIAQVKLTFTTPLGSYVWKL